MFRLTLCAFALAFLASGCCGPMGCGPGCDVGNCYDCDGTAGGVDPYANPFDSLIGLRKKLVCGSGCGETYYGEWMSTPPHCEDPCEGDQFVGGAVQARPFCWAPGTIVGALTSNLYGGRFCDSCGESIGDCGCGAGGCSDGGNYVETGDCGCASCSASQPTNTRLANRVETQTRMVSQRPQSSGPGRR